MNMDNKALGKGLSALISQSNQAKEESPRESQVAKELKDLTETLKSNVSLQPTELIDNNSLQPRQEYDPNELEDLKASIMEKGILQPILIRPRGERFEVVAGERRLRAAREIGLEVIPAVVREFSDSETLLVALVENMQREDLNVIDEAKAFEKLVKEFKMSQDQIAKAVGKDRATISNTLRLLKLPAEIQAQIVIEEISMGHARALLALDTEEAQLKMAKDIISHGLSVRSVEGLVKQTSTKKPKQTKAQKAKDPDVAQLEDELRRLLGTKVSVEDKKGKGKLVIEYYTLDDLDRILDIIRKK
jgi:ParB family transcriptional regulator, chromosome partitioning protein